jgi:uncharacterized RDD family membrane protein YckC
MQCPKCGSLNPDSREQCSRCGAPLSETISAATVPDWRKEVTKKVKAYGDRKRSLTTPPGPIKERTVALDDMPEPAAVEEREVLEEELKPAIEPPKPSAFQRKRDSIAPSSPPQPPRWPAPNQNSSTGSELHAKSKKLSEGIDIWKDDLVSEEVIEEEEEPQELRGLKEASRKLLVDSDLESPRVSETYFWRRTAAFFIDSVVLCGAYAALVYGYSALMQDDVIPLIRAAWPSICELLLLAHFLYYLYFYSTSRQTPGQVFFSIELRESGGGPDIPFHKILVRWLSMVLFNLFNLLPLLFGKSHLLMDQISGTEIRALK